MNRKTRLVNDLLYSSDDSSSSTQHIRQIYAYPHVFPIAVTHREFPLTSAVKNLIALPLGVTMTPFIPTINRSSIEHDMPQSISSIKEITRCKSCYSYINPFCDMGSINWMCSFCEEKNSFSRSHSRYRNSNTSRLPELNNILIDYPIAYKSSVCDGSDGATDAYVGYIPKKFNKSNSISSSVRPLVHIFYVQENMPTDCMEATVESIIHSVNETHPDIHVLLMTFSNRIGLYHCSSTTNGTITDTPSVEYIHLTGISHKDSSSRSVFHGDDTISKLMNVIDAIEPIMPLNEAFIFNDSIGSIRDSKVAVTSALSSLFNQTDTIATDGVVPQVHTGPCIEALIDWLTTPAQPFSTGNPASLLDESGCSNTGNDLTSLLSKIFIGNTSATSTSTSTGSNSSLNLDDVYAQAPADVCSGIVLHLFLSDRQDIPEGLHDSCTSRGDSAGATVGNIDRSWSTRIGKGCSKKGISINVYAINSFEGKEINLMSLFPLSQLTGGSVDKFVLGSHPLATRIRLNETLRTRLTRQMATKCIMKVRTSSVVNATVHDITGNLCIDDELSDVYHVSSCNGNSSYGLQLDVSGPARDVHPQCVLVQIAFSYDTLVETSDASPDSPASTDNFNNSESAGYSNVHSCSSSNSSSIDEYVRAIAEELQLQGDYQYYISNELKKRQSSTGALEASDLCCYNHTKALVAVRRLRIITLSVKACKQASRLNSSINICPIAALITRKMMFDRYYNGKQASKAESLTLLLTGVANYIASIASIISSNSSDTSVSSMNELACIDEAIKYAKGNHILQYLYSVYHLLETRYDTSNSSTSYITDDDVVLLSTVLHIDEYSLRRLTLPTLLPVFITQPSPSDNQVHYTGESTIALTREAMCINAHATMFFIDNLTELMIYQPIQRNNASASTSTSSSSKVGTGVHMDSYLINNISNRIKGSPVVPQIIYSTSGTSSSGHLTGKLIEEGMNAFVDKIVSICMK